MKALKHLVVLAVTAGLPAVAMAHPGHDHSSPWAAFIHLAWIAPLVGGIAFAAYKLDKKKNANQQDV